MVYRRLALASRPPGREGEVDRRERRLELKMVALVLGWRDAEELLIEDATVSQIQDRKMNMHSGFHREFPPFQSSRCVQAPPAHRKVQAQNAGYPACKGRLPFGGYRDRARENDRVENARRGGKRHGC